MKVLNLYAGIGGNRKLWGEVVDDLEVIAVEIEEEIAEIYQDNFPQDEVIVGDAMEFIENNYKKWDFIWASPPCPSHSTVRNVANVGSGQSEPILPDMDLYSLIIFLQQIENSSGVDFDGDYCVENVISYYDPLVKPQKIQRHYFWASFHIPDRDFEIDRVHSFRQAERRYGFDLSGYNMDGKDKGTLLRNVVRPELGKHILESALKEEKDTLEAFC